MCWLYSVLVQGKLLEPDRYACRPTRPTTNSQLHVHDGERHEIVVQAVFAKPCLTSGLQSLHMV